MRSSTIDGETYRFAPGDYGCIKVGTLHAWRNPGTDPVRWLRMAAPQPKPHGLERDTFFQKDGALPGDGAPLDPADPGATSWATSTNRRSRRATKAGWWRPGSKACFSSG